MTGPSFLDVLAAHKTVQQYLPRTPLYEYPSLGKMVNAKVWVKHENHQPVGAFKVRGGVNLVATMDLAERERGIITASTGNHGQSVAYAAKLFGVRAIIAVPEEANPVKVEAIEDLGGEVIFHGNDFDEAREYVEELAREKGYRYIHAGNEPFIIAGVATCTLEILQDQPDIETVIVPVGGGSGASGACIVAKTINPSVEVIGVQSKSAPSAYLSWKEKRLVDSTMETAIDGLATRTPFVLPQSILWKLLDDFVLVSDEAILRAIILMIEKTHNVPEGAGAAPLAAALKLKDRIRGRRVALILSGGNISPRELDRAMDLAREESRH